MLEVGVVRYADEKCCHSLAFAAEVRDDTLENSPVREVNPLTVDSDDPNCASADLVDISLDLVHDNLITDVERPAQLDDEACTEILEEWLGGENDQNDEQHEH